MTTVIHEDRLRRLVAPGRDALAAVEDGFARYARSRAGAHNGGAS